jgi:integrase
MPGVFRTKDKKGRNHKRWRFWYIDRHGHRIKETGNESKLETLQLAHEKNQAEALIRNRTTIAPDERVINETVAEYVAWGKIEGTRDGGPWTASHSYEVQRILENWQTWLNVNVLADLVGKQGKVENVKRERLANGSSPFTVKRDIRSLKSFIKWCLAKKYLREHPMPELIGRLGRVHGAAKCTRRALTEDEISRLLQVVPLERKLIYQLAVWSGLRANEIRTLQVCDLDVTGSRIVLKAERTKNRTAGYQPIPSVLVAQLSEYSRGKQPTDTLLFVSKRPAAQLRRDLKKAGVRPISPEGKVDFHALRSTYVTLLIEKGANIKEVQELARHSSPELTLEAYVKARDMGKQSIVDGLVIKTTDVQESVQDQAV